MADLQKLQRVRNFRVKSCYARTRSPDYQVNKLIFIERVPICKQLVKPTKSQGQSFSMNIVYSAKYRCLSKKIGCVKYVTNRMAGINQLRKSCRDLGQQCIDCFGAFTHWTITNDEAKTLSNSHACSYSAVQQQCII